MWGQVGLGAGGRVCKEICCYKLSMQKCCPFDFYFISCEVVLARRPGNASPQKGVQLLTFWLKHVRLGSSYKLVFSS